VKDEHGQIIGASAIASDITEQKRAEQELEQFFTVSPDMLCIAGFDGYFKRVNPAWVTALGWSIEHLLETPLVNLIHPDDINATKDVIQQQQAGAGVISFENRYRARGECPVDRWPSMVS